VGIEDFINGEIERRLLDYGALEAGLLGNISLYINNEIYASEKREEGLMKTTTTAVEDALKGLWERIEGFGQWVSQGFQNIMGEVSKRFEDFKGWIWNAINTAIDNFQRGLEFMHWTILDFSYAMGIGLLPLISTIDPRLLGIQDAIADAFKVDVDEFVSTYAKALKSIREKFEEMKGGVSE
jgi:hypothetical protein